MNTQIEAADQRRTRYRGGHVIWLIVFFIAWVLRSALKIGGFEAEGLHVVLLGVLILSVLAQGHYALRINLLEREIRHDAELKRALNNELVCLNQLNSMEGVVLRGGYVCHPGGCCLFVRPLQGPHAHIHHDAAGRLRHLQHDSVPSGQVSEYGRETT